MMGQWVSLSVVIMLLAAFAGCRQANADNEGERLYQAACARCHGTTGEGGAGPAGALSRDLTDPEWQKTVRDDELRTLIQHGRGQMPAFSDALSLDKIDKIVKHLRVLKRSEASDKPGSS